MNGLITAIRTLTVLSVPGRDADEMTASLPWFPVVGLLLGAILYGIGLLLGNVLVLDWPEAIAFVLVAGGVVLTRGLHLDGLSDWADGFWGARDRERVLAIMKDSATGTFGTAALTFIILAKWLCLVRLVASDGLTWVLAAGVISRTIQVDLAVAHPYARAEGGTANPFVRNARGRHLAIALAIAVVLLLAVSGLNWVTLAALAGALVVSRLFGSWSRRRIGGVTGDILGAGSEIVETLVLAVGAVLSL